MKQNFCVADKYLMCVCTATDSKLCKFYAKSSAEDRCMWRSIQLGANSYHCDNVDAQYDCRNTCK